MESRSWWPREEARTFIRGRTSEYLRMCLGCKEFGVLQRLLRLLLPAKTPNEFGVGDVISVDDDGAATDGMRHGGMR